MGNERNEGLRFHSLTKPYHFNFIQDLCDAFAVSKLKILAKIIQMEVPPSIVS